MKKLKTLFLRASASYRSNRKPKALFPRATVLSAWTEDTHRLPGLCTRRFCMVSPGLKKEVLTLETDVVFTGKTSDSQRPEQTIVLPLSSFCPDLILAMWWAKQVYLKE